jgi:hypothetical protein
MLDITDIIVDVMSTHAFMLPLKCQSFIFTHGSFFSFRQYESAFDWERKSSPRQNTRFLEL